MLKKTLLTLSASVLLGTAVIIPNAALAQLPGPPLMGLGGPPLGGSPPGLGAGGPPLGGPPRGLEAGPAHGGPDAPPRFSRLDAAPGGRGIDHSVQSNLHGFEGRASAFSNTAKTTSTTATRTMATVVSAGDTVTGEVMGPTTAIPTPKPMAATTPTGAMVTGAL